MILRNSKNQIPIFLKLFILLGSINSSLLAQDLRTNISMNGTWEIEESTDSFPAPSFFSHKVQVPGLVNKSEPAFPNVDEYTTSELKFNLKIINELTTFVDSGGVSHQNRNYFWYRKKIKIQENKQNAFITIKKAQFGSTLWVNGNRVGGNFASFTSKRYNITEYLNWGKKNTILIRIGAHPGVLPKEIPYGIDYEKYKWTPGIYDDVEISFNDNPVIEQIQIAPNIYNSTIVVQTKFKNYGEQLEFSPNYQIHEWKSGLKINAVDGKEILLANGEEVIITDTLFVQDAVLWDTKNPFLYEINVRTPGDDITKRFGMREFKFETSTRRAYLNGKIFFLRGSNIALHRFFEDPECGSLPWDEKWVRKMLAEIPKSINWNSFRFVIGSVPDKWFDIADEEGILIQNEFFIWTLDGIRYDLPEYWSVEEVKRQLTDWMSDSWNHPSLVIWDAMNESKSTKLHNGQIIQEIRKLDLSNRPWEVSFNPPTGPNDVVEYHPYLFNKGFYPFNSTKEYFKLSDFESLYPTPSDYSFKQTGQSMIVNEYGWLWLNRDGSPTIITKRIYDKWLGKNSTKEERFKFYAYALAGHTEFLRAYRNFAGIQHFVYLTSSHPGAITSDNFIDIKKTVLEPHFMDYVGEAFKPVGVYLNFWQAKLEKNQNKRFTIMVINDEHIPVEGELVLHIENSLGEIIESASQKLEINALGQKSYWANLKMPNISGDYIIHATAKYNGLTESTVSRRKVKIE